MRYYDLKISDDSGAVYTPTAKGGFAKSTTATTTFTSHPVFHGKQVVDPGALNLEIDAPVAPFNASQGNSYVRVWGIGLQMIGQAANLNGANITLRAGMKPGLPLATAAANQAGIVLDGKIFSAFGNWQGTNQTLDLICNGLATANNTPISVIWKKGMSLTASITVALKQAFPQYNTPKVTIGSALVWGQDQCGYYENLGQFSEFIGGLTQRLGKSTYGDSYPGAQVTIIGNTIYVNDYTSQTRVKQIAFQDLIGQPTWINAGEINFKTVMRADLAIGSVVQLPQGVFSPYALISSDAAMKGSSQARDQSIFQGTFRIQNVHHFGNFRQPDADSWNTTFDAVRVPGSGGYGVQADNYSFGSRLA